MNVVCEGYDHGVYGRIAQHGADVVIDPASVNRCHLFRPVTGWIVIACNLSLGMLRKFRDMPYLGDFPAADYSDSFGH